MSWTSRESNHAYDGLNTWDAYAPDLSVFAGATLTAQTNTQDLLGMMLVLNGPLPSFIQSKSFCTATGTGTYTSSVSIALPGVSKVGNCLIVFLGALTAYGGSFKDWLNTFSITDTNGNTWAPIPPGPAFFAPGSGDAAMGWYCTVGAGTDITGGTPTTVTITTSTTLPNNIQDYSVAIHEYSGIYSLSIPPYRWSANTCYPNSSLPIYLPFAGTVQGISSVSDPMSLCSAGKGKSGATIPSPGSWSAVIGGTTTDNYVVWGCSGAPPGPLGGLLGGGVTTSGSDLHSTGAVTLSFSGAAGAGAVLLFSWIHSYVPVVATGGGSPLPQGWYIANEPSGGLTDQSARLFTGQGTNHSGNLQARQRGNWTYTLISRQGDSYEPTLFQPVYFYDQTPAGFTLVFAGIIQSFKDRQIARDGDRYIDVTAVSLESILDTVMVTTPKQYVNQTCGFILTDLFNAFESGSPVTLGTIQAGATIPLYNAQVGAKLSEIFTELATTSSFTWNINPSTQQLFFGAPTATQAPFSISSAGTMWDTIAVETDGSDYRNRQAVRVSFDAMPHSMEYFVGAGQKSFTLARPVKQVVAAYVTLSTCNTATAALSGQPSPGDTFTVGPANGVWQSAHVYSLGGVIVDANGFVQKVTTAGTSGGSVPTFSQVTGQTTTDNTAIWTCQGPLGLGTGAAVYTWVSALDNTQFGQVLIGANVAASIQNAADALNANAAVRGTTFSLPTWENSQINAVSVTGTGFTAQQKAAGSGWVASISATGTAFSWSAPQTSGGTSPQGSVGPNEPATISIQVYAQGTSTASPGLAYTEGSATVTLATPLNSGTNLNIEYTRADGDVIQVENTALVTANAATTHGTGKDQQITDATSLGLISTNALAALQLAQGALAAYQTPPQSVEVEILRPGIFPGQLLQIALTGYWSLLNSSLSPLVNPWYVEEVRVEYVEGINAISPWMDQSQAPNAGHYRYTLKLINAAQIGSYLDWWLGLGGGSGGSSGPLAATSGGAQSTAASQTGLGSPLTTKGDLWGYDTTNDRVAVGTDGQILTADSSQPLGVSWKSATGVVPTAQKYTTSWSSQTSVTVTHNFGTTAVVVQLFDGSGNVVIPQSIQITSVNALVLTFGASFTGSVVVAAIAGSSPNQVYTTSWTAQTTVTVTHDLGSSNVFVQVYNASGNVVTPQDIQITSNNVVTLTFGAVFTGSVAVLALASPVKQVNASWSSQTSVTITHDLATTAVVVQVYDGSGNQVVPQNIQATDINNVVLTFGASFTGKAVVMG